jgi:cobalt/nickel transport system permease protein
MAENNGHFIERSISAAASFLKDSVFTDGYASGKGFLQAIDPRIKVISFAIFLLAVLFSKHIAPILVLYAVSLVLAGLSRVDIGFFLKRTWIFIPLFSLFIAIPALFSVFTPGDALIGVKLWGKDIAVTRQGLFGALLFVSRVATSVSFAVLLSLTTRHFELLRVLRVLGVPQVFVMVLGMCYRYIYLFTEVVENTYLAVKSRVGHQMCYKRGQHLAAWNMASLWYRSYRLNEAVYGAMLSRGYTGEVIIFDDFKARAKDWAWLFVSIVLSGAVLYYG